MSWPRRRMGWKQAALAVAVALPGAAAFPQQTPPPAAAEAPANADQGAPRGKVLFQSHGQPPAADASRQPLTAAPRSEPAAQVPDRVRAALTISAYDLDLHLAPARSELAMRARVSLRNQGAEPLKEVPLQISGSLRWDSVAAVGTGGTHRLAFTQALLDTDADHTGQANEAVITLDRPLEPGAATTLDALYAGRVPLDAGRLTRLGATPAQASAADWDTAGPQEVALRGFGNVLWYPVASPPLFLGDGAALFQAIGRTKLRQQAASVRLHLAVEYAGDPPAEAIFCGRTARLRVASDLLGATGGSDHGIATAEFPAASLGFRTLNLFVPPGVLPEAGESSSSSAASSSSSQPAPVPSGALSVASSNDAARQRLEATAEGLQPFLAEWLGPHPRARLTVIDHPGQPFQDGALVLAPLASLASAEATPALVRSFTRAWADGGQPWMDEGLAEFMELLWTERTRGREAALAAMNDLLQPLALGEPAFTSPEEVAHAAPGQPLIAASEEVFYRRKAAAVWWMLRDLAGESALKAALAQWQARSPSASDARVEAVAFQKLLEASSGKDLAWFFNDWVLRDLGLPDLTLADVTPRPLPAGKGHDSGWLVAVTVRNEGAAAAEVPLVIRSGAFTTARRVRIPGLSSVTERVVVQAVPTAVTLNDGSTPEVRASMHSRDLSVRTQ